MHKFSNSKWNPKRVYKQMERIRNVTADKAREISNALQNTSFFNDEPKCVEILRIKQNGGFSLDEEALTKIFYHPDVINNPVMILSVCGAMRQGKSFLLSLLVLFLESNLDSRCFESSAEIPKSFKWRGGVERETLGIKIWSKPFILKLNETKSVAVLLMDTQGAFDKDGTSVSSEIFAFSTLMSSVQVYNIDKFINESHLQPLKMFVDYASILNKSLSANQPKPFQKLQFLIRDWSVNSGFSMNDGQQYLDNVMNVSGNEPPDVVAVRESLKNAFSSLNCTLLPYPGGIIAGHEETEGPERLSDIHPRFKQQIRSFFSELLKPENLQPKQMNGTELTGFTTMNFICKYYELLESGNVSKPMSVIEAVEVANFQTVVGNLLNDYNDKMTQIIESVSYMEVEDLLKQHQQCKKESTEQFDQHCKNLQFEKTGSKYQTSLKMQIENAFLKHKYRRNAKEGDLKEAHRKDVQELFSKYEKKISKTSEPEKLENLKKAALDEYDDKAKRNIPEFREMFRERFETTLVDAITVKEKTLKAEKELVVEVSSYLVKYKTAMEKSLKDSCVCVDELDNHHNEIKAAIVNKLHENAKQGQNHLLNLKPKLTFAIEIEYERIKKINQIKLNAATETFMERLEKVKQQHLEYLEKSTKGVYVSPSTLENIHLKYVDKVKKMHSDWEHDNFTKQLKQIELTALDKQYQKFATDMEEKKGSYRESNFGAKILATALVVFLAIPALALGIVIGIIVLPYMLIKGLWKAVTEDSD